MATIPQKLTREQTTRHRSTNTNTRTATRNCTVTMTATHLTMKWMVSMGKEEAHTTVAPSAAPAATPTTQTLRSRKNSKARSAIKTTTTMDERFTTQPDTKVTGLTTGMSTWMKAITTLTIMTVMLGIWDCLNTETVWEKEKLPPNRTTSTTTTTNSWVTRMRAKVSMKTMKRPAIQATTTLTKRRS